MKRVMLYKYILDCSNCNYCNIWARYCELSHKSLPEKDSKSLPTYDIPKWCKLNNPPEENPVINIHNMICPKVNRCGITCAHADQDSVIFSKDSMTFKCKLYNINMEY